MCACVCPRPRPRLQKLVPAASTSLRIHRGLQNVEEVQDENSPTRFVRHVVPTVEDLNEEVIYLHGQYLLRPILV